VLTRVMDESRKQIYARDHKISQYLSRDDVQRVQNRPFGFEGWLPLAPGHYKVEWLLSNELKKTTFRVDRDITVPTPPATSNDALQITQVVPFLFARPVDPSQ